MHILPEVLRRVNTNKKLQLLLPFLKGKESVLDFGCGDLSLAKALKLQKPFLSITGVDILDVDQKPKHVSFIRYEGRVLPFRDKSFDTVLAFYVLHHCESAEESLRECVRVAKKRVIIIESIPRHQLELPFMLFVDWLYNVIKPLPIAHIADQFYTLPQWKKMFKGCNVSVDSQKRVTVMVQPSFLPLGRSYLFVLKLR